MQLLMTFGASRNPGQDRISTSGCVLDDALALDELREPRIHAILDARHLALLLVVAPVELALRVVDVRADVGRARALST